MELQSFGAAHKKNFNNLKGCQIIIDQETFQNSEISFRLYESFAEFI